MGNNDQGFHFLAIVLVVLVTGVIGLAGWKVFGQNNQAKTAGSNSTTSVSKTASDVIWAFENTWQASASPPTCENPLSLNTPTPDLDKATSALYPGQMRGGDYKSHGGFRFDNSNNGDISVTIPRDGHLTHGSRYIEQGEVQYFLVFSSPCGIIWRFDHLLTLSPKFQAIADKLPEAKVDDSRTTKITPPVAVKTGETVATAVGFKNIKNVGFDFGILDVRAKNAVSSDPTWAKLHANDQQNAPYGVCWFDMLPDADAAKVKSLPPTDGKTGNTSDYC